jgi:hypothetical protein
MSYILIIFVFSKNILIFFTRNIHEYSLSYDS